MTQIAPASELAGDGASILRRFYTGLRDGDLHDVAGCVTPDIVLHVLGRNALSGDYQGAEGLRQFAEASRRLTAGHGRLELVDLLAGDAFTAALCRVTGEREGTLPLDNRTLHLARLEGGRIAEIWFHNYDQHRVDAFWGPRQ